MKRITCVLVLLCATIARGQVYKERTPTRDGIGRIYMGREIAHYMSHMGADWLDRPEREAEEAPTRLMKALDLKPTDVVADIGAGTGYFSFKIAPLVPQGKVLAEDIQPEMLDRVRKIAAERGVKNVEPVLGDEMDPKLPARGVDMVLLVDSYHEFDHPREMMLAIRRALKPGGRVVQVEYRGEDPYVPIKPLHKMTQKQAIMEMAAVGLRHVKTDESLPRQHVLIYEKAKKLIEFGWDEPNTDFMRTHISEMEKTPFDGCVFDLYYTKTGGAKDRFISECWGKKKFSEAELQQSAEDLRNTKFTRFTENFLRFDVTPGDVDWFDDFSAVISNANLAAKIARQGKARGILFDVEPYANQLWDYRKQRYVKTKAYSDYAQQARRRGREMMIAMQAAYPDITIFTTFGYSAPYLQSNGKREKLAEAEYGLLAPFLDGMIEAAKGESRIVDGFEFSYSYKSAKQFGEGYEIMKTKVPAIVLDPAGYARATSFGFGLWMDYDWRKHGWDMTDVSKNFFTPQQFEESVREALRASDDYVWIYTEDPKWWSEKGPVKVPGAYDAALRNSKQIDQEGTKETKSTKEEKK